MLLMHWLSGNDSVQWCICTI